MNNKIIKLQLGDYFKWKNLSREDKVKRNKQIAKLYLDKGPSILNYYNALKAYFGGFNPKNPYLLTGEPTILPGMNPTKGILTATNVARTLEDYLKTTKVTAQALEGSSSARSAYATDRFIGGRLFLNTLPEEAMKILGHGMAKSPTILDALARLRYILDNGIKGKFYTAPLKVSKEAAMAGEAIGTGGATPYFDGHFLITGKPGLMINSVDDIGTVYINDAYENEEALKAAQKMKEYLTKTYPNKVFKLYSEGFKKGGTIKTANARKWKHKEGGIVKALFGWLTDLSYKLGLGSKGDWKRMRLDLVDFGVLLDNSENPNQLIGGPTILPSRVTTNDKIISSVAKINDKGLPITKRFNNGIKNDATFLTGDKRFANSGRNKITKALRERALYMITNHYSDTQWNKDLLRIYKNIEKAKAKGIDYKKYNKKINETLDDFIWNSGFFKKGGVIKAQGGTKMDWSKIISTVGSLGSQAVSTAMQNKSLRESVKLSKQEEVSPMEYMAKYFLDIADSNARAKQAAQALGSTVNFNPEIDKHFAYLLANQEAAKRNLEVKKNNKLLDAQVKSLQTLNWLNLAGSVALTGLGYLTSSIGKKATTPTSTAASTTTSTTSTNTSNNFNNYMNNIYVLKQLGIV